MPIIVITFLILGKFINDGEKSLDAFLNFKYLMEVKISSKLTNSAWKNDGLQKVSYDNFVRHNNFKEHCKKIIKNY